MGYQRTRASDCIPDCTQRLCTEHGKEHTLRWGWKLSRTTHMQSTQRLHLNEMTNRKRRPVTSVLLRLLQVMMEKRVSTPEGRPATMKERRHDFAGDGNEGCRARRRGARRKGHRWLKDCPSHPSRGKEFIFFVTS